MDQITKNLLANFVEEQALQQSSEQDAFEKFATYSAVFGEYSDEFNVEDAHVGGENDTGIDGLATIVNGRLITDEDEIDDLLEINRYLDVTFVFVQAKTSRHFDAHDIGQFYFGVKDFFREEPTLPRNEGISAAAAVKDKILVNSASLTRGNPDCKLYYVTTGRWNQEANLVARINAEKGDLVDLNIFSEVIFTPIDASKLQNLYKSTRNRAAVTIQFENHITLPDIQGVSEAYLGILPGPEYLKLISDEAGNIRKSLFYDNVRDFQGGNPVNQSIGKTIEEGNLDSFAVRNNGVAVVAKSLNKVGNRFSIEDYQVVNGCQTSHVLYNMRDRVTEAIQVPLKLIVTEDENVTNAVITSSNNQTPVKEEDLQALSSFQKKLEDYYNTFEGDKVLNYERRSKQYSDVVGIEKVRIISIGYQMRFFAAMFLDEAHRAGRYPATLLKQIGGRIFVDDHYPDPYYTSAYAAYKLEWMFRNNVLDREYRTFRYHLLMAVRRILQSDPPPWFNSRKIETYCEGINEALWSSAAAQSAYEEAIAKIQSVIGERGLKISRDTVKTQSFRDGVLEAVGEVLPGSPQEV